MILVFLTSGSSALSRLFLHVVDLTLCVSFFASALKMRWTVLVDLKIKIEEN